MFVVFVFGVGDPHETQRRADEQTDDDGERPAETRGHAELSP